MFPLVFVTYTEARGPFVHRYPYCFLDPRVGGGISPLILAIVGITLLFFSVGSLIYWLHQKRGAVRLTPVATARVGACAARRR